MYSSAEPGKLYKISDTTKFKYVYTHIYTHTHQICHVCKSYVDNFIWENLEGWCCVICRAETNEYFQLLIDLLFDW